MFTFSVKKYKKICNIMKKGIFFEPGVSSVFNPGVNDFAKLETLVCKLKLKHNYEFFEQATRTIIFTNFYG